MEKQSDVYLKIIYDYVNILTCLDFMLPFGIPEILLPESKGGVGAILLEFIGSAHRSEDYKKRDSYINLYLSLSSFLSSGDYTVIKKYFYSRPFYSMKKQEKVPKDVFTILNKIVDDERERASIISKNLHIEMPESANSIALINNLLHAEQN